MFGMGHWEILIILLIVLLVFGAKRIPDMAQGLGRGIKEFRKAMHDVQEEIDVNAPPPQAANKIETSTPAQSVSRGAGDAPASQSTDADANAEKTQT